MDTGGKLVNNDTVQLSVTDECGYVLSYLTKVRVRITSCPTNNMDAMRNTHPKVAYKISQIIHVGALLFEIKRICLYNN